jgi:glycerol-3-phosphate dehydrogenase (NAD(P)+)
MGAEPTTAFGPAGLGDLYVTATSPRSRNRTLGEMLGYGKSLEEALDEMHMVAEGVRATRMFVKIAPKLNIEIPFLSSLSKLLDGEIPVEDAVRAMVASYQN